MPVSGLRPEWERENNRTQIIFTLLEKSLTFTELLNKTGLARSTLSNHLKELQEQQIIEKAIENGRVVYRTTFNEERLESEFKKASYDFLYSILLKENPVQAFLHKFFMKMAVKIVMHDKKRKIEGKPLLDNIELIKQIAKSIVLEWTQEERKIGRKLFDPLVLKHVEEILKEETEHREHQEDLR